MNEWFMTDDSCLQYCRYNSDDTYDFIEMVCLGTCKGDSGYPNKEYTVKTATINLNDYSDYDKECAISAYYHSFDEIYETYGMDMEQIIAECIFEGMTEGVCQTYGMMTEAKATKFIEDYIKGCRQNGN